MPYVFTERLLQEGSYEARLKLLATLSEYKPQKKQQIIIIIAQRLLNKDEQPWVRSRAVWCLAWIFHKRVACSQ